MFQSADEYLLDSRQSTMLDSWLYRALFDNFVNNLALRSSVLVLWSPETQVFEAYALHSG